MAREYARVKVNIWADSDFRLLSRPAQGFYFQLISSPTMSLCGVADWRPNRLAALTAGETAWSVVEAAIELAEASYVAVDEETEEILVRSFIRHDGLIKTPNIAAAMVKDYAGVASGALRGAIIHELLRLKEDEPSMKGWSVAAAILSNPSVNPSTIPSPNPLVNPYTMGSGNGSHIPQPSSLNQQPTSHTPAKAVEPDGFGEFWAFYPRKADKGHARKAWAKALKITDAQTITDAAQRLSVDPNLPEPKFIPLASTWLNGERWEDGPLPPRNGTRSTDRQGDLLRVEMERARAADARAGRLEIGT